MNSPERLLQEEEWKLMKDKEESNEPRDDSFNQHSYDLFYSSFVFRSFESRR